MNDDPKRHEAPHAAAPQPLPRHAPEDRGPLPARLIVPDDPRERVRLIIGRQRR